MDHTWLHSSPYAALPPYAVIGGHDSDGSPIYVGRSFHEGDNLPAKVVPSKGKAYICWGGKEITKTHYEVLVGQGYGWVPCYGGAVPPNAVRTGTTRDGEPLYVGRGHHAHSLCVGKIHPSHGCLYIPFGGQEVRINTYEVLVQEHHEQWVASTPNYTPPGAVIAGHDTDRATIYVGRAMHEEHKWVPSHVYSSIPPLAVEGGHDSDGAMMYVGRSFHSGDMLVVEFIPSQHSAVASWRGRAIAKDHFEVLCGRHLVWRHCYDHIIPEQAVLCGRTALDQPVYIGRGHYDGCLAIGKVSSVHRALFIAFGAVERRLETYEILVSETQTPGWAMTVPSSVPPPLDTKPCAPPLDMKPYPPPVLDMKPYPLAPQDMQPYPPPPPPPEDVKPYPPPSYTAMPQPFEPPPPYAVSPPMMSMPMPTPTPMPMPMPLPTPCPPSSRPHDMWMSASSGYTPPPHAVRAGHDVNTHAPVFVSRAFHHGDLVPGKYVPSLGYTFVSFAGQEVPKTDFELLVGEGYDWVSAHDGHVPPGAVEGGRCSNGEPLYVGRAHFAGSLTCGKVQRSHRCLYIAYGGAEQRATSYEVLVRRHDYYREQSMKMAY